jgi:pimeloyl-ACP methyl ester carboxylesterase
MLCWSKKYLSQPGIFDKLINEGFYPITITGYKNQLNALLTFDSRSWLNKINKPCLIIGANDDLMATAEEAQYLASAIPNAEYFCFQDVGHVPMVEQTEVFNNVLFKFLEKFPEKK